MHEKESPQPAWRTPLLPYQAMARDMRLAFSVFGPFRFSLKLGLSLLVGFSMAGFVLFGPTAAPMSELTLAAWCFILTAAFMAGDAVAEALGKVFDLIAPAISAPPRRAYKAIGEDTISRGQYRQGLMVIAARGVIRAVVVFFLVGLLAWSYAGLPTSTQQTLFGPEHALPMASVFVDQLGIGVLDSFVFFLPEAARQSLYSGLGLTALQPTNVEGVLIIAGLKLYGFIAAFALLRIVFAPVRIARSLAALRQIVADVRALPNT